MWLIVEEGGLVVGQVAVKEGLGALLQLSWKSCWSGVFWDGLLFMLLVAGEEGVLHVLGKGVLLPVLVEGGSLLLVKVLQSVYC